VRLVASLFISAPDRRQPLLSHALRAADSVVLEGGENEHQSITASQAVTISTSVNASGVEL
jgi:hypothetical protein